MMKKEETFLRPPRASCRREMILACTALSAGMFDVGSLLCVECCCKRCFGALVELEVAWACECRRLWGSSCEKGSFDWWKEALRFLEDWAAAVRKMDDYCGGWLEKLLSSAEGRGLVRDRATVLFALTRRGGYDFQRSVAAYATQDVVRYAATQQRLREVRDLCWCFSETLRQSLDVEDALRRVLSFFPFLPARSAHGADRVIDELSKVYAQVSTKKEDDPKSVDAAKNAAYILWYSIALLNTDLHNPRISSKITEDAFATSLKGTILGHDIDDLARKLYRSLKAKPLLAGQDQKKPLFALRKQRQSTSKLLEKNNKRPQQRGSGNGKLYNNHTRHTHKKHISHLLRHNPLDYPILLEYLSWATILTTVLFFLLLQSWKKKPFLLEDRQKNLLFFYCVESSVLMITMSFITNPLVLITAVVLGE